MAGDTATNSRSLIPIATAVRRRSLQRQAEQYAQLFRLFRKHADAIARVSFWNLHDGQSWLNDFPWKRVNYPLLFDRAGQPKPAFEAVIKGIETVNALHSRPIIGHYRGGVIKAKDPLPRHAPAARLARGLGIEPASR